MYFVVTGAAGFIGSNLVRALNARGETQILAVDDLERGDKFRNLAACEIADYLDKDEFRRRLEAGDFSGSIDTVFDQAARRRLGEAGSQIAGFRYFNVYGPNESHKGRMASVAWHFFNQYSAERRVRPFVGSGGYGDGEQRRDFISVEDVTNVNLHFLDHPELSGIFNVGTGRAQSFNDVALATINCCRNAKGDQPV